MHNVAHKNVLDFNDAQPQHDAKPAGTHAKNPLDDPNQVNRLKERMALRAHEILEYLWPSGMWEGDEYVVGDVRGEPGRSLKVSCHRSKIGVGQDFATGEVFGDLIDCWSAAHGKTVKGRDFAQTIQDIERWLGDDTHRHRSNATASHVRKKKRRSLPPPSATWIYKDKEGTPVAEVRRYDIVDPDTGEVGKTFLPWDVKVKRDGFPTGNRPMYNQPGIAGESHVVLVEGEKCADALIEIGIPATCVMGGSKTRIEKIDWSPIVGKHVVIWPDADQSGIDFASRVAEACYRAGAASAVVLTPPEGKNDGWDAADAIEEGMAVRAFLREASQLTHQEPEQFKLQDVDASDLIGHVPPVPFLVEGCFQTGRGAMVAAMGGVGKSFGLLDLAFRVATGIQSVTDIIFGGRVRQTGTAVFLSSEDSKDDFHRRLDAIDLVCQRAHYPGKLRLLPMLDLNGIQPLIEEVNGQIRTTPFFDRFVQYLKAIDDLRLVVIDTATGFFHVSDLDTKTGSVVATIIDQLAVDTGAAVIIVNHMKKVRSGDIQSLEAAREAIKGNSAGLDRLRMNYALWLADHEDAKAICKRIRRDYQTGCIIMGGIVKANGPYNHTISTYFRHPNGRIEEVTDSLIVDPFFSEENQELMLQAIKKAAEAGQAYTHTGGGNSLYVRKEQLPKELQVGRNRIEQLAKILIDDGRVIKCTPIGTQTMNALDVPGGTFAIGARREPGNQMGS